MVHIVVHKNTQANSSKKFLFWKAYFFKITHEFMRPIFSILQNPPFSVYDLVTKFSNRLNNFVSRCRFTQDLIRPDPEPVSVSDAIWRKIRQWRLSTPPSKFWTLPFCAVLCATQGREGREEDERWVGRSGLFLLRYIHLLLALPVLCGCHKFHSTNKGRLFSRTT